MCSLISTWWVQLGTCRWKYIHFRFHSNFSNNIQNTTCLKASKFERHVWMAKSWISYPSCYLTMFEFYLFLSFFPSVNQFMTHSGLFLSIAVSNELNSTSSSREGLFFTLCHGTSPTSTTKWPHPVDFKCIFSPWTAFSPYLFNIRQSIQRTPKIRLPLSRVGNIPSFLVFAGVHSPCLKQCSIIHAPAMPTAMFPRYSKDSFLWVSLPSQAKLPFIDHF